MKTKEIFFRLLFMFAAVLVFTFFDWIVHSSISFLSVPSWYFRNKIIYGTLYAWMSSLVFQKQWIPLQAALIASLTVTLLQIRYVLYGFPFMFHAVVVFEHLVFLYASAFAALILLKKYNKTKK